MHHIKIKASPLQLSKLRNGHKVRISKAEGEGCNLIVHPQTYHLASRAFAKNKGLQVALSPEEIAINKQYSYLSPEQHAQIRGDKTNLFSELPFHEGKGLFRPKGGAIKLGKVGEKILDKGSDIALRVGEKALTNYLAGEGIRGRGSYNKKLMGTLGNTALNVGEKVAEKVLVDYLTGNGIRGRGPVHNTLLKIKSGLTAMGKPFEKSVGVNPADIGEPIGDALGPVVEKAMYGSPEKNPWRGAGIGGALTGYEAMKHAGLAQAHADHALDLLEQAGVHARRSLEPYTHYMHDALAPRSRGQGISKHTNIGGRSELIGYHHPPALISQPLSANFQMQHFLPPQYQAHFYSGQGLYT